MSSSQHIKSFSSAVGRFRSERDDKRSLADIDKILAVLSKISDTRVFESQSDFFSDLNWLLRHLAQHHQHPPSDTKTPASLYSCITLLTRLSSRSVRVREILRDRLCLLSVLGDLLVRLPPTSHEKGHKLLDLMRFAAYGVQIRRLEEFLLHLVPKLLEYVEGKDANVKLSGLFLLISLCRGNHVVTKFVLSLLTERKRKLFFAAEDCDDPRMQVLTNQLNLCLSQANLSRDLAAASSTWSGLKFEERISRISDAMCAAYGEEDCLQMESFADFLAELCKARAVKGSTPLGTIAMLSLVQQVILVTDLSEGHHVGANEAMFHFLRQLLSLTEDPFPAVDVIVKVLQLRLESQSALEAYQAVALLHDLLREFTKHSAAGEKLDDTKLQSIRLQLDPLVAVSCQLVLRDDAAAGAVKTQNALIQALIAACDCCRESVSGRLRPASLVERIERILGQTDDRKSLLANLLLLCRSLAAAENNDWERTFREILSRSDVRKGLVERLRSESCRPNEVANIISVLSCSDESGPGVHLLQKEEEEEKSPSVAYDDHFVSTQAVPDKEEVNSLISKLYKSAQGPNGDHDLAEVLELGDYRLCAQLRQMENLKASLRLADQRIAEQNQQFASMETELARMTELMRKVFQKSQMAEEELKDIRIQHTKAQDAATDFKNSMIKSCAAKDRAIAEAEEDRAKVVAKALKYKEENQSLQKTIAEHIQTQEELQMKLTSEAKANADLTLGLEKREEKLRKKSRQLEDEMSRREKMETELESAKKEVSSLQSLSSRQQQALAKKEKQLQDQTEELAACRKIQEQIFNLSKLRKD